MKAFFDYNIELIELVKLLEREVGDIMMVVDYFGYKYRC